MPEHCPPQHLDKEILLEYISRRLKEFRDKNTGMVYPREAADEIIVYYSGAVIEALKAAMEPSGGMPDHHKAIAGLQCAIMECLLVRHQDDVDVEGAAFDKRICKVNAAFALFVGLDMLKHYAGVGSTEFIEKDRPLFIEQHMIWLTNRPLRGGIFPLHLNAQLWYALEEICALADPDSDHWRNKAIRIVTE